MSQISNLIVEYMSREEIDKELQAWCDSRPVDSKPYNLIEGAENIAVADRYAALELLVALMDKTINNMRVSKDATT